MCKLLLNYYPVKKEIYPDDKGAKWIKISTYGLDYPVYGDISVDTYEKKFYM